MATDSADPLLGQVLGGRFEILEVLGKGGMGRVYKARQQPLDRIVALKVLNPRYDSSKDPGFERRFFLEASMTARLKHPNTITVHDYGRTDDGIFFIAMEYLEGETLLHELTRVGRLPWARAFIIGAQIARSLREAHKLGLVHRDLKPANIMLLSEGTGGDRVKVLDFGLVKPFHVEASGADAELTQAGVLLGSPLYMAPEQAKGLADPRTDIYALGVLLFQCIAGRTPFSSRDSIEVIVKHIKEKPPELRHLVPEIPLEVHGIVMRCLEKKPGDRFQSMDELLDTMRSADVVQGMSGLFADPRFSQPHPRTSAAQSHRSIPLEAAAKAQVGSPATSGFELDSATPIHTTQLHRSRRLIAATGTLVVAIAIGVIGAYVAFNPARPLALPLPPVVVQPPTGPGAPLKQPAQPEPAPRASAVEIVFDVQTEPPGATVTRDGAVAGTTPLALRALREPESASPLQVELGFALAGYEPATLKVQGLSGTVLIRQALRRVPPTPKGPRAPKQGDPGPPTKDPSNDYKDDPYQ